MIIDSESPVVTIYHARQRARTSFWLLAVCDFPEQLELEHFDVGCE